MRTTGDDNDDATVAECPACWQMWAETERRSTDGCVRVECALGFVCGWVPRSRCFGGSDDRAAQTRLKNGDPRSLLDPHSAATAAAAVVSSGERKCEEKRTLSLTTKDWIFECVRERASVVVSLRSKALMIVCRFAGMADGESVPTKVIMFDFLQPSSYP